MKTAAPVFHHAQVSGDHAISRRIADRLAGCAGDRRRTRLFLAAAIAGGLIAVCGDGPLRAADSWSAFQNGGRLSRESGAVPKEWSPTQGIAWRTPLVGTGQSSPVIQDGLVYVTSCSGPNKEMNHIAAVALANGEMLWKHDFVNPTPQENGGYVSVAAPTPAADAAGVICFFEGGTLAAMSPQGDVRWERNLVTDYGPIVARHGLAASVEQSAERAFIWVERQDDPYVLAVDKTTGETHWKVPGLKTTSWASPRLVEVAGGSQLVLSGVGLLHGLDPATGERLWTFDDVKGNSTPTPVPVGDGCFLIGATDGRGEGSGGNSAASNGLIEIRRGDDGQWKADYVWRSKRATSSFGSPMAAGQMAYFVNRVGVLFAADLATGEERYAERLGDSAWATPLAIGDRVFIFGKGGSTTVIAAGASFERLAENACWVTEEPAADAAAAPPGGSGPVLYGVAYAEGLLVIRKGDELIAIGTSETVASP